MSKKSYCLVPPRKLDSDVTVAMSEIDGNHFVVFRDTDPNGDTMLFMDEAYELLQWLQSVFEPPASFVTKAIEELQTVEREIGAPSEALKMIGCSRLP